MKELFLTGSPLRGEIREVDIPISRDDEVLIKVVATDSNPKDWQNSEPGTWMNQGDDISGIVHSTGSAVTEFKPGDRVAAFHRMLDLNGAHAEFAIAPYTTTFNLPPNITFEEGATIPLAAMTAALALYQFLQLLLPWDPVPQGTKFPVLIYGGASAVGAFALKLAKLSNCNPIITVAGRGIPFVESLGAAHTIVDYRNGNVGADVKDALKGQEVLHAFDAVCAHDSWKHLLEVLPTNGKAHLNVVDPPDGVIPWPPKTAVKVSRILVASAYGRAYPGRSQEEVMRDRDFAYAFYRYLSLLLQEGRFTAHPFEVLGGLEAIEQGTISLFEDAVSAKKLVYRISDIPGL